MVSKKTAFMVAFGATLTAPAGSFAAAGESFAMQALSSGYMLADASDKAVAADAGDKTAEKTCAEGKCAEGQCAGYKKANQGKCAEGKCKEGKCAGYRGAHKKVEGKCAEGKCKEGKCGGYRGGERKESTATPAAAEEQNQDQNIKWEK